MTIPELEKWMDRTDKWFVPHFIKELLWNKWVKKTTEVKKFQPKRLYK